MNNETINTILLCAILGMTGISTFKTLRSGRDRQRANKIYIDTSTLMDGRILAVAQTGFITDDVIILSSVLREMQLLADSSDNNKRARARAGLTVANELERTVNVNAYVMSDDKPGEQVDDRLLELAKQNRASLMTNDFNLNKRATAEGVRVMNINEMALALRNEFLPGERLKIMITDKGSNRKQGIGYLPDGTMAVVEGARDQVGKEAEIELVRFNQTPAGKMIFARTVDEGPKRERSTEYRKESARSLKRDNRHRRSR